MKTTNFFRISVLTVFAAPVMIGCISAQNAQTMNDNNSKSKRNGNVNSAQPSSGQTTSSSTNSNSPVATIGGLAKYQDKKINSLPTKPVSLKYVVEHRTALNDKIITVSGIVVGINPPSGDSAGGVRSMANPQPRVFIADSAKDSRDKNRDLMVLVEADDKNYAIGQKVTLKVKVESSQVAVVLRKVL